MREIKFRAWSKTDKKHYAVLGLDFDAKEVWCEPDYEFTFDEVVIEQFTGLCDKNGVEIYEGDIVEMLKKGNSLKGDKDLAVGYSGMWGAYWLAGKRGNTDHWMGSWVEVIGGIHESKEI